MTFHTTRRAVGEVHEHPIICPLHETGLSDKWAVIMLRGRHDTFFGALFPLRGNRLLEKMLDLHGTACSHANMPFQPVPAAMG